MKKISLVAMTAAAGLFASNALAADLGGDCCADLEERVAELEATTARKGNRKVSLTVYGHVNTAVMYWDNGVESNVYVVDNDNASTRFGFRGEAKINSDWSAGFNIELEPESASSNTVQKDNDDVNAAVSIRRAFWFLKSKQLGQISVGQEHSANSGIAEITLGGTNTIALLDNKQGAGLSVHNGAGAVLGNVSAFRWGNAEFNNGVNIVRYDTPTFAGFQLSASWGEDDLWDVALRYAGEIRDIKIAAGFSYGESTDAPGVANNGAQGPGITDEVYQGSISVLHTTSGLFVTAAGAHDERNVVGSNTTRERDFWAIQAGIFRSFNPLGKTSIYGEYRDYDVDDKTAANVDREAKVWGLGIVQYVDAAAMELYLGYQNNSFDQSRQVGEKDVDVVMGGAIIKF